MSLVLVRRHVPIRQKSESAAPSLEADCSRTALPSQPGRADDMERPVSHRQSLSAGTGLWPTPDIKRLLGPEALPQSGAAGALEEAASKTGDGGSTRQLPQRHGTVSSYTAVEF